MRALALLTTLSGCQLVFSLDDPPDGPLPPDADLRPAACKHQGLLLCLSFDDDPTDGTTDDLSGRGLNATTSDVTATERAAGEPALGVTTDSSVVVQGTLDEPGSTALDLPTPVSYDLWVLFTEVLGTRQIVLDNEFEYGIQLAADDEFGTPINVGCNWVHPGIPNPDVLQFRSINVPTTLAEWHHVACVYDGEQFHMFHDSVVVSQGATGPLNATSSSFLNVGRAGTVDDPRNMTGQIDNVRIWDRPLTQNDVQLIFMGNEALVP